MKTSKSVTNFIQEAEDRAFRAAKAEARLKPLTLAQVLASLDKRARSAHWWLNTFGAGPKKRPEKDIEEKRHELAVFVQVRDRLSKGASNDD